MARLGEVPHTPYFGTIDATPLWLLLVARHANWTGDPRLFNELRPHVEAALDWMKRYGDRNGDGYLEYECKTEQGLANQGWKDSGDAVVNADGSLATPPIALVEVQGYAYGAKIELAGLFRRIGDEDRATALETEAEELRKQFNDDFWLSDGYYALALQKDKHQAAVLSSNAGQALWSGIAEPDRARQTAARLLSAEMFNGWGIRTLSASAVRYNPLGYHLGTVWPHDNSLIAAGFKRYGFEDAALRVLAAMLEAAVHFEAHRLPELFGGFSPGHYGVPVNYPVACQPQAWAAGAMPYLVSTILGLEPDAFSKRLSIVRPCLPENVHRAEIRQLQVGAAYVDLLFERTAGAIEVRVESIQGELEVEVQS
jgi:glycogen debranching enzyme